MDFWHYYKTAEAGHPDAVDLHAKAMVEFNRKLKKTWGEDYTLMTFVRPEGNPLNVVPPGWWLITDRLVSGWKATRSTTVMPPMALN